MLNGCWRLSVFVCVLCARALVCMSVFLYVCVYKHTACVYLCDGVCLCLCLCVCMWVYLLKCVLVVCIMHEAVFMCVYVCVFGYVSVYVKGLCLYIACLVAYREFSFGIQCICV